PTEYEPFIATKNLTVSLRRYCRLRRNESYLYRLKFREHEAGNTVLMPGLNGRSTDRALEQAAISTVQPTEARRRIERAEGQAVDGINGTRPESLCRSRDQPTSP